MGRADLLQQRQNPDLVAKTPNVDLQFVRQIPVLKTAEERAALVELEKPHAQMGPGGRRAAEEHAGAGASEEVRSNG